MKNWRGTGINYRSPPPLTVVKIKPYGGYDKIRPVDVFAALLNILIHGCK